MTAHLTMPTLSLQVAFQDDPYALSPTWTDITRYAESISVTSGRQHELQQVAPATMTVTLTNQDGRFSPWNTSSVYYHSGTGLVNGHPVRVQATWSSTTYPIFYGVVKSWTPGYGATQAKMTLQCYDFLALCNLNTLDTGQYDAAVLANAKAFYPLSDPVNSSTAVDLKGGSSGTVVGSVAFGVPGPLLTEVTTGATSGQFSWVAIPSGISGSAVSGDGWIQTTDTSAFHTLVQTGTGGTELMIQADAVTGYAIGQVGGHAVTSTKFVCDGNWHYLALTSTGSVSALYVDGQLVALGSAGSVTAATGAIAQQAAGTGTVDANYANIGVYNTTLTAAQINTQYALGSATWVVQDSGARVAAVLAVAGVPSALTNIPAGNVQCQGSTSALNTTTAASYLQTIVNTERGLLYQDPSGIVQYRNRHYVYENSHSTTSQATFGYAGGQLHYFSSGFTPTLDDIDVWNSIPVQRTGGTVQTAQDATSQAAYGRRTLTGYTNLLFTGDVDSADLAGGLLYQYKQPQARVRAITMDSTISAGANLPQMLGRALLDRITVNWRPVDNSGVDFSQQSLIEGIQHTITPEKWTTAWALTPIGTENFATYGTDVYGTGIYGF